MKMIWLTQGQFTLVDDEDYEYLNRWEWCVQKNRDRYYAGRTCYKNDKKTQIIMHREILKLRNNTVVDHKDGNGLFNVRSNLREATSSQNSANRKSFKKSSSQFMGVSFEKYRKKWHAQIQKDGVKMNLGYFYSEIGAAIAYNKAASRFHGEFANLNKINL